MDTLKLPLLVKTLQNLAGKMSFGELGIGGGMLKSKPTNIVADPFQSLGGERPGV